MLPSQNSEGESIPRVTPSFWWLLSFLGSLSRRLMWSSSLCVPTLLRTLGIGFRSHPNSGQSHLIMKTSFIISTKTLFPRKFTPAGSGGGLSLGGKAWKPPCSCETRAPTLPETSLVFSVSLTHLCPSFVSQGTCLLLRQVSFPDHLT